MLMFYNILHRKNIVEYIVFLSAKLTLIAILKLKLNNKTNDDQPDNLYKTAINLC